MSNQDLTYLISLNHFSKFGQSSLKKLKKHFSSWEAAFQSSVNDLIQAGIKESIALEFMKAKNKIIPEKLVELMSQEHISAIEIDSPEYPDLLKEIYDPPAILFYKGNIKLLKTISLGVVGARKNTPYGQQVCTKLCSDLIKNNFTVTSGLALGIDSLAHNTALDNNGQTIAVLGAGINNANIYPAQNKSLAERIINNNGLLISEFTLGSMPTRYNFPMRNRIISGLSLGVLVIESAIRSGANISARLAIEQNREIFAVPGNIFSTVSDGPNHLIKQGATPTSSIEDILETLDLKRRNSYINNKKVTAETEEEKKIITHLSHEPIHIDDLARLSGLTTSNLSSSLTLMEMRGIIKNFGGMQYALL